MKKDDEVPDTKLVLAQDEAYIAQRVNSSVGKRSLAKLKYGKHFENVMWIGEQ